MADPTFARPSQGHLIAFDYLMKVDDPFTPLQFLEGCNDIAPHGLELKPKTARSYLRAFVAADVLEETSQYPMNVFRLKDGWGNTVAAHNLKAAYYYS